MSGTLEFTALDRVLVIAPHPDDESIATGGLLQIAHAAGATCRVVIVTDGDNNPWPQRWSERRWRIGANERARWGARRRAEAMAALSVLGLNHAATNFDVQFLGLPDLGLTDMLMRMDERASNSLRMQIDEFQPTWLVLPALNDRHPDHSALHVMTRVALAEYAGAAPKLLAFGVHGELHDERHIELPLTDAQRAVKRTAIFTHASQMQLSGKRFLAYAKAQEPFQSVAQVPTENPQHPLHAGIGDHGELLVHIDRGLWPGRIDGLTLFVVVQYGENAGARWQVALGRRGDCEARDCVSGLPVAAATLARSDAEFVVTMPLLMQPSQGYVKLARATPGMFVFDRFGWQTIGLLRT